MNYYSNPYDYLYNNGYPLPFGGISGPIYSLETPNSYATNNGVINHFPINGGQIDSYNPSFPRGINSLASHGGSSGYSKGGNIQKVTNVATHGGKINNLNQNINNELNIFGNYYNSIGNNCVGCTQSTENLTNNVTKNKTQNKTNTNNDGK